jgi:hypothetical protein
MMRRVMVPLLLGLAVPAQLPAQGPAAQWWADVKALADDSMRGRDTGSPEHHKAALYIAAAFKAAGLAPAGTQGYFQPVPFTVRSIDETQSTLAFVRDGTSLALVLGEDAVFQPRAPLAPKLVAPLVFVGYGLHLPEYQQDDLAGIDLKGKVVVYLAGSPPGIPGPVLSHARNQAWAAFRAAGAIGAISFSMSRTDTGFTRAQRNRGAGAFALADAAIDALTGNQLSVQVNSARAERLIFAAAPERFDVLAARADSGLPLPHFPLPITVSAVTRTSARAVTSENVAGILRGTDPKLRNEYVVLTAHLDHIGITRPVNGDSINNGAMDNGSGSALLMDVPRQLAAQHITLKRSIIFLAVTGEEKGLLGSRYYANHPTVPAASIIADLNTDMFLPIIPFTMVMVNGLEESNMADDARRAGVAVGVPVITDPEPEENRFVRSDQYSFILRGIPALSMKVGFALNTPEHQQVLDFRTNRYHHVGDDVNQHVDLEAAAGFERYYIALVQEVANRDSRPAWNADSYFRRFAPAVAGR